MQIEIIQNFYDYSWRLHNPDFRWRCNPADVNITTHLRVTDIHGKWHDLLDHGSRYDSAIYQKSHSRYDLILETFIIPMHSHVIFRLCELEPDFNPETADSIIPSRDKRKRCKEHYIGFAMEYVDIDYSKHPQALDEDPYVQIGVRCEMRARDKMFHWLNKHNFMNSDEYDECCRKQTQIIPLNNQDKNAAAKELNDAIMNELTIIDLGGNTLDMLGVICDAQNQKK